MLEIYKKKNPESKFWNWFVKNKSKIEKFIENPNNGYETCNQLIGKMKEYNELLFPEITIDENNKYVLIITPDGLSEGVKPTQKLGESHPEIENWIIKKFRQPTDNAKLNINGLEYPSSDIKILPTVDTEREKVDIQVYIKNMNNDKEKYQHLAFLYFDHILGEFNTITRVGYIDFYQLDENQDLENAINLIELRKLIEQELY